MDNDPVNPSRNDDEEYQFSDEESAHKYKSPAAASSSSSVLESGDKVGVRRKKLMLIIIGVIVGVFCLYKLYGLFIVAPSKTPLAPTQTQPTPSPGPPPVMQKSEQIAPPPVLSSEKLAHENLNDKISAIEKSVIQNSQGQENLQNQIGGISSAITEIQSNIAMLTQQINTLAQQKSDIDTMLKEKAEKKVSKTEEAKKTVKKSSHYPQVKKKQSTYAAYYVRAMVQGRAWLISSTGAILTISTGDQLPGYGQIQAIDPDKGIVMTSSGKVISYMSRDR